MACRSPHRTGSPIYPSCWCGGCVWASGLSASSLCAAGRVSSGARSEMVCVPGEIVDDVGRVLSHREDPPDPSMRLHRSAVRW